MPRLTLAVLGCRVHIECAEAAVLEVVGRVYGLFLAPADAGEAALAYRIDSGPAGGPPFRLFEADRALAEAHDLGALLFHLDQDVTVSLQRLRADLLFVHAGAVETEAGALVLVGESGAGKSTMAWALLHEGAAYLGDELAPIDLGALEVQPFPRALCLKREPPGPYPVPRKAIRTPRTSYVSHDLLPAPIVREPRRLATVVFVGFSRERAALRRVSTAEATARLYASVLNALAHEESGLPAAERVAQSAECVALSGGPLRDQAQLLVEAFPPRRRADEPTNDDRARKAAFRSGRSR